MLDTIVNGIAIIIASAVILAFVAFIITLFLIVGNQIYTYIDHIKQAPVLRQERDARLASAQQARSFIFEKLETIPDAEDRAFAKEAFKSLRLSMESTLTELYDAYDKVEKEILFRRLARVRAEEQHRANIRHEEL